MQHSCGVHVGFETSWGRVPASPRFNRNRASPGSRCQPLSSTRHAPCKHVTGSRPRAPAFPLLYNNLFLVGTMNYVAGIGLMLWAVTTWMALRERSWLLRLPVSAAFVLALFFCHLFALGVYGLALLAFELHRLWTSYAQARVASRTLARQRLPAVAAA